MASQPLFHAVQLSLTATGAAPLRGKQLLIVPKEQSEQTSRSAFHLCQVSVMFALHKRPCCSDPRVVLGVQSGHTSSISGDHRGGYAAWSREPSGWMDWNSSGCGCRGGDEGWQQLLCAGINHPFQSRPPPRPTHSHCCLWITVSKSLTNQFCVDLWDHHPFIAHFVAWALTRRPPSSLPPTVYFFVPCDLFEDLWSGSSGVECTKHTQDWIAAEKNNPLPLLWWFESKTSQEFFPRSLRTVC